MKNTRKINGEVYTKYTYYSPIKQVAQQWAQELRAKGNKVRIVKGGTPGEKKKQNMLFIRKK